MGFSVTPGPRFQCAGKSYRQPRGSAVAKGDDRRIGGVARRLDGPSKEGEGGRAVHRRRQWRVRLAAAAANRRRAAGPRGHRRVRVRPQTVELGCADPQIALRE